MHIPDVDLNLFVVFDAIYAEGGVSRACSRLNLTQPRETISTVRQSLNGFETALAAGKSLTRNGLSESTAKQTG